MRKPLLLLVLAALALPAAGETTRFWRQESFADFDKGTAHGVALRSDGEILLAPRFREVADPNLEFLWAVVADRDGALYLGGGSPAKVVKVDAAGQVSVAFESKELEVHALATDPKTGTVYAATSPDGSLYEIPRQGTARVLFEPKSKYLWDLVRLPDGTLYLATGDKGEIFRITPDGQGKVFFTTEETHVRALALDPKGTLYAGTEPNGLVLRISPEGQGFVVYETERREVTSLVFDSAGNLYVAAIGQKAQPPAFPTRPPVQTLAPQQQAAEAAAMAVATVVTPGGVITPRLPFLGAGGSDIYRIAPDGYPVTLWSSATELVYSLSFDPQGRLLVGTGNEGKLLAIDSPVMSTNLVKASSQQITALLRGANGTVYLGTANPGKLLALGPELETEGSLESDVFDAQIFSQWGRISWRSRAAVAPGGVTLFTRSGNASDPQKNWSPWSQAYTDPEGVQLTSPQGRFLQWKAVLRATDSRTPSLSGVNVAYLRRNAAPMVEKIIVQAPGVAIRGVPQPPMQAEPAQLELPPPPSRQLRNGAASFQQPPGQPQRFEPPPQGMTEPNSRSVIWSADDENDDTLEYALYYRGEGEARWKLMKDELRERFYTWDAATLPDGAYTLRVLASDAPSNPPELAQTGENISDRFEVDNTPPRIDELAATPRSRRVEIGFVARDSYSPLKKAEYSVDAGEWKPLFPQSGTTDAREHRYAFGLEALEPGEHTVVVRVYDRFDNPALAKTTFTVK